MPVHDKTIEDNLKVIDAELETVNKKRSKLIMLHDGYTGIKKTKEQHRNFKGGFDKTETIPNPNQLSSVNLAKIRQIVFDDCNNKFKKRND